MSLSKFMSCKKEERIKEKKMKVIFESILNVDFRGRNQNKNEVWKKDCDKAFIPEESQILKT